MCCCAMLLGFPHLHVNMRAARRPGLTTPDFPRGRSSGAYAWLLPRSCRLRRQK